MKESKTYKVGMYLRLSREDEEKKTESESITNQRNIILEYITRNGFLLINEYCDDGISGTTFDRPSFKRMIEDCEKGVINTIITKDMSRLGRDHIVGGDYMENYFKENNIRYIAINDDVDSTSDNYDDLIQFKLIFNEYYPKDISKKVRSSINIKKKKGQFLGGIPPYGYNKNPNDKYKLVIDEYSSKIVKRMFEMFADGMSLQKIARTLNKENIAIPSVYKNLNRGLKSTAYGKWQTRTIDEILKNPTYIGNLTQGRRKKVSYKSKKIRRTDKEQWIIAENTHEPIVTKELFDLVQQIYATHKNTKKGTNDELLRGLLYCKECGHTIGINKGSNNKKYCTCNYYKKYSKENLCTPHSIPYEILENEILKQVRSLCKKSVNASNFEMILKNNNSKQKIQDELKRKINKYKTEIETSSKKIEDVYMDKLNGKIDLDFFTRIYNKIITDTEELKIQLQELEQEYDNLLNEKETNLVDYQKKINEYLSFKKPSKKILISIIEKIEIDEDKNIDIHFRIRNILNSSL